MSDEPKKRPPTRSRSKMCPACEGKDLRGTLMRSCNTFGCLRCGHRWRDLPRASQREAVPGGLKAPTPRVVDWGPGTDDEVFHNAVLTDPKERVRYSDDKETSDE